MAIKIARRQFIATIGGSALNWPLAAHAQRPIPTVGFLHGGSEAGLGSQATAFRDGLRKGGYIDGQNVNIEYRWADGRFDQLPALAAELVRRPVDVIATIGGDIIAASALPPKAAAKVAAPRVRFGPGADMLPHSISSSAARCPHWVVNG